MEAEYSGGGVGTGLPVPGAVGDVLFSLDGATFTVEQPVVSADDGWLANDDGELIVEG